MNGGLDLLDHGSQADVFGWDGVAVLKLYREANQHLAEPEGRWLEVLGGLGFPVPAPRGLIRVNGRLGLRMERVCGASLEERLWTQAGEGLEVGALMGQLHARLHALPAAGAIRERFPDCPVATGVFATGLDRLAENVNVDELRRLLVEHGAGDAACHGDFHPSNVFVVVNGNMVLDWCDSYLGPAESDVASTIVRARAANPDPAASTEETERFYHNLELMLPVYLRAYLQSGLLRRSGVEAWVRLAAAQTLARRGGNEAVLRAHLRGEFTLPWPTANKTLQA